LTLQDSLTPIPYQERLITFRFSPKSNRLAAPQFPASVPIWDVSTGRLLTTLQPNKQGIAGVEFSPDGSQIAVAYPRQPGVDLWDVESGQLLRTLPTQESMSQNVRFAPRGGRVAALSRDGRTLYSWDSVTGDGRPRPLAGVATCLEFDPDGKRLL